MQSTQANKLYLLAFLSGWLCMVNADLETVPLNIAALAGSTITFSCSQLDLPTSARVLWREYASNAGGLTISDGKLLNPTHPSTDRYAITGTALEYNLEIRDISASDAGLYFCEDINGPPASSRGYAELVVLESDPVCEDFVPPEGIVIEQNLYNIECEMRFAGNIKPIMTWSGPSPFTSNSSNPDTSVWSDVRFTALRTMEGGRYTCRTNFTQIQNAPPGYASNAPDYEKIYEGAELYVTYGPLGIKVTPIQGSYVEGDVLTCWADCKPDCTYAWTNLRTLGSVEGENYTILASDVGYNQTLRCQAKLELLGNIRTADIFHLASVPAITTPPIPTTTPIPTAPPADAPCTDPTGRWSSINPDATLCLEVDARGNLLTLIRNGTDLFFVSGTGKTVVNDYKHIGFTGVWPQGGAVGGFVGECHRCLGVEVIQLSGLYRNKYQSTECGTSSGTQLTKLYTMTRSGPPCRGETLEVYGAKPGHLEKMGIKAKGEIFKPLN
jgi:hypothetical protein